jgi:hypothetical protein
LARYGGHVSNPDRPRAPLSRAILTDSHLWAPLAVLAIGLALLAWLR